MGESKIKFKDNEHEAFYEENLAKCEIQDSYHKALIYCLGIGDTTRSNISRIYDFRTGCVKPECLHEGWQTRGSGKIVRMAFNLYCDGIPGIDENSSPEDQLKEMQLYTVSDIFCTADAKYFWEAIKLRYPEYASPINMEIILDRMYKMKEEEQ